MESTSYSRTHRVGLLCIPRRHTSQHYERWDIRLTCVTVVDFRGVSYPGWGGRQPGGVLHVICKT